MSNDADEKPLTFSHLVRFYNELIEPRFQQIDKRFDGIDAKLDEHEQRFDDLYKNLETLRQEYILSNEHIRRLASVMADMKTELKSEIREVRNRLN